MKKLFLLLTLITAFSAVNAQKTHREIVHKFFELYSTNTDDALDYIYKTNKWVADKKEALEGLKAQLRNAATHMGDYYGHEIIGERSLGESLKIMVYLAKYDREPLRFTFKFYKPKDNWVLYGFSFDDDIDEDLEEIMKYEYLNQ